MRPDLKVKSQQKHKTLLKLMKDEVIFLENGQFKTNRLVGFNKYRIYNLTPRLGNRGKNKDKSHYKRYFIQINLDKHNTLELPLSKFVWMFHNQQLIPEGYEIHHADGNRLNDAIENLQLLTIEKHKEIHRPKPKCISCNSLAVFNQEDYCYCTDCQHIEKLF